MKAARFAVPLLAAAGLAFPKPGQMVEPSRLTDLRLDEWWRER